MMYSCVLSNEINFSDLLRRKGIHVTKKVGFTEIAKEMVAAQGFLMLCFIRRMRWGEAETLWPYSLHITLFSSTGWFDHLLSRWTTKKHSTNDWVNPEKI